MTRHVLVIGAQRCGTTYLHELLAAHPAYRDLLAQESDLAEVVP